MAGGKGLKKTHGTSTFLKKCVGKLPGEFAFDNPKIWTLPVEMKPVPMVQVVPEVAGLQLRGPT